MKTKEELRAHHLYKFLYSRCIFDKFLKNALKSNAQSRREAAEDFISGKIGCISFLKKVINIDMAFNWAFTLEGHSYWSKLNATEGTLFYFLWCEYCKIAKKT